jgi:hypothetical protein
MPSSDDNTNKGRQLPLSNNTNKQETESPSSSILQLNVTWILKISMTDSLFNHLKQFYALGTTYSYMRASEELFSLRIRNSDRDPVRYPLSWLAAPFCCLMNVPNANCSFWGENSMGGYIKRMIKDESHNNTPMRQKATCATNLLVTALDWLGSRDINWRHSLAGVQSRIVFRQKEFKSCSAYC